MKKALQIIASAVVAIAALTSCAKEEFKENAIPAGEKIQVSINGQIGELTPADATKATAGSVVRVTWETGDEVYVYDGTACIGTLTVTPDEKNASYALLSGTIHSAASPAPSKLTLVYVKDATKAPDIAGGKISIDLSTQDQTEVPFVLYTTIDYDAAKLAKENEYISFSFATSVMTVNCTGLQTGASGAVSDIDRAEIDGVSTICELSVTGDGVTVAGTTPGTITRTGTSVFQQSDQRASFSVALAKTAASVTGRTIKVTKGGRQFTASYPKNEFDVSKSFNSVFALKAVPYSAIPFTITSTGSTTVAIVKQGNPNDISLEYKKGSAVWATYTIDNNVELNDGESVQFRAGEGGNEEFSKGPSEEDDDFYCISVDGEGTVSASGNIMSLLDSSLERTSLNAYMFYGLFGACMNLTDASNLVLPATTLAESCYNSMFATCFGLTAAPALPATTLAESCYNSMFAMCIGLTAAPALPATKLAESCYEMMFSMCIALTAAPALPATTLAESCYCGMFIACTGLTATPALPATDLAESCYDSMFSGCTGLTSAPALPATTLAESCYDSMFSGCTGLIAYPALPATTLAKDCYNHMFNFCDGLTAAPALPATTLAESCYHGMFNNCTSLTAAPALPATELAEGCYCSMFSGCTGLTAAPALTATTLVKDCYREMFSSCAALTSAPVLPATTLVDGCYFRMFSGCSNLNFVKALFTTIPGSSYTDNWLNGVASSGTFVRNASATWDVRGSNGIPADWTVKTESPS